MLSKLLAFSHSLGRMPPAVPLLQPMQQGFGVICVITPPAPPATKPATLTFRVGCESEHGIAGIRLSPMSSWTLDPISVSLAPTHTVRSRWRGIRVHFGRNRHSPLSM
jgi:hypothetical protein